MRLGNIAPFFASFAIEGWHTVSSGTSHNNPTRSDFQETSPFLTLPTAKVGEVARFVYTDKIVGRLGEFPELTKAVREGDLEKVSILCEQLFQLNSDINIRPKPIAIGA
ncbi:MAG TPA: hypothetical protein VK335_11215 [Bryobacteraceae bacterium]|nr:hypothetical protein [Bryobacteraceae bacterium]